MNRHQAIWYDHDGYIANDQYGNHVVYDIVTVDGATVDMLGTLTPTGATNLPEGWPIYDIAESVASVAINPIPVARGK